MVKLVILDVRPELNYRRLVLECGILALPEILARKEDNINIRCKFPSLKQSRRNVPHEQGTFLSLHTCRMGSKLL